MGHFSRDCPAPRNDTARVCYNCNSPGWFAYILNLILDHMSRECPNGRGTSYGHERRAEGDTLFNLNWFDKSRQSHCFE